jgi:hypothetical protein
MREDLHLCRKCGVNKPYSDFPLKPSGNPCSPCRCCRAQYYWKYVSEGRYPDRGVNNPERAYSNFKKWCSLNPEKRSAHQAVTAAIRKGKLVRPDSCSRCGKRGKRIEAHHFAGYAKENKLKIQWLCSSCHGKERIIYAQSADMRHHAEPR